MGTVNIGEKRQAQGKVIDVLFFTKKVFDVLVIKKILSGNIDCDHFLWLNSQVKHKRKSLNAGLLYHSQLLDNQYNYLCFEEFACKFNLSSDNETYLHYVTLYLAIPESGKLLTHSQTSPKLQLISCKLLKRIQSVREVYLHLTNSTYPEKQQLRWADEFSLNPNTFHLTKIYTKNDLHCNYGI